MSVEGHRDLLGPYFERRGDQGAADYRVRKNRRSLDGLPAYDFDPMDDWATLDGLTAITRRYAALIDGWRFPVTYAVARDDAIDLVNRPGDRHGMPAVMLGYVLKHDGASATIDLTREQLAAAVQLMEPAEACTEVPHPNLVEWRRLLAEPGEARFTAVFVRDLDDEPTSTADEELRRRVAATQ